MNIKESNFECMRTICREVGFQFDDKGHMIRTAKKEMYIVDFLSRYPYTTNLHLFWKNKGKKEMEEMFEITYTKKEWDTGKRSKR